MLTGTSRFAALLATLGIALPITAAPTTTTSAPTSQPTSGATAMRLVISSKAFGTNQPIPRAYTGEGQDTSPDLSWSGGPAAAEYALICDDPNAPRPEPWVHWVLYKIPANQSSLKAGLDSTGTPKDAGGALQGKNSWDTLGYRGPLPPPGHGTHHYHFRLYALDTPLKVGAGLTKAELLAAMKGHVLGEVELVGTYKR